MSLARIIVSTEDRENYGDEENPSWKNKGGSDYVVGGVDHTEALRGETYIFETFIRPVLGEIEYDHAMGSSLVRSWAFYWDGELTWSEKMGLEYEGVSQGCLAVGAGGAGPWCPIWSPSAAQTGVWKNAA